MYQTKSFDTAKVTLAQIEGFRQALAKVEKETISKASASIRQSYASMIRQLQDELCEYDKLKSGALDLPHVNRLDQIAPFIAKIRIARGVSQTELTRRLSVRNRFRTSLTWLSGSMRKPYAGPGRRSSVGCEFISQVRPRALEILARKCCTRTFWDPPR